MNKSKLSEHPHRSKEKLCRNVYDGTITVHNNVRILSEEPKLCKMIGFSTGRIPFV